jgi:hypothetical protein
MVVSQTQLLDLVVSDTRWPRVAGCFVLFSYRPLSSRPGVRKPDAVESLAEVTAAPVDPFFQLHTVGQNVMTGRGLVIAHPGADFSLQPLSIINCLNREITIEDYDRWWTAREAARAADPASMGESRWDLKRGEDVDELRKRAVDGVVAARKLKGEISTEEQE